MDATVGDRSERVPETIYELPYARMPFAPDGAVVWLRLLNLAWVLLAWHYWNTHVAIQFFDYWTLEALGYTSVFWTNFWMQFILWSVTVVLFTLAIGLPAIVLGFPGKARSVALQIGLFVGLLAGPRMMAHYAEYLELFNSRTFGVTDPVFNRDIGYYIFEWPALLLTVDLAIWVVAAALGSAIICSYLAHAHAQGDGVGRREPLSTRMPRLGYAAYLLGAVSTPMNLAIGAVLGVLIALRFWLHRFDLLFKDNAESLIYNGAEALDVTGIFSTRNDYYLSVVIVLALTAAIIYVLYMLRRAVTATSFAWQKPVRNGLMIIAVLIAVDFAFKGGILLRDNISIKPDEPVAQQEFLQRHVDSTLAGYRIDNMETVPLMARTRDEIAAPVEEMLENAAIRNAPLWPGFVTSLEHLLDPQHAIRLEEGLDEMHGGDLITVYGPTMDTFRQEQRLRGYYDFLEIDNVRYTIDGEQRMFVSSVRETPVDPYAPQPWLLHWAQQHILYTHGHGLVMIPASEVDPDGGPVYASGGLPSQALYPELALENEATYYYEGAETHVAFTNTRDVKGQIASTDATFIQDELPEGVGTGIPVDSLWKRIVFGQISDNSVRIIFSSLLDDNTQAMTYRIPIDRAEVIAPFLYIDNEAFAVASEGDIVWMLNAVTYSKYYPYSRRSMLGDTSDVRSEHTIRPHRTVNYVEDSVKITVNGYTGETTFYKISNDPVIEMWASIYPDLFTDATEMPESIESQLQYPIKLFHIQFDNIFWRYHMRDAMDYFFAEDLLDDADEVLGGIIAEGESINFSVEPFNYIVQTGDVLPESSHGTQFVLAKVFTPEAAVNLRMMPMVYQDGEDYGRLVVVEVPKGQFIPGPEQADAAIDQEPSISEQISWWNRMGNEVIRGHTTPLLVGDELIYVEPLFIRSRQNPLPQLKRVIVVFRGHAAMAVTLEEALRDAVEAASGDRVPSVQ
jgi:uncharacterized protein